MTPRCNNVSDTQTLSLTGSVSFTGRDSSSPARLSTFQGVLLGGEGAVLCKGVAGDGGKDPQRTLQLRDASPSSARLQQASQLAPGPEGLHKTAVFR